MQKGEYKQLSADKPSYIEILATAGIGRIAPKAVHHQGDRERGYLRPNLSN